MPQPPLEPRSVLLAGDIGGTKALLALSGPHDAGFERHYPCDAFGSFDSLLRRFLDDARANLDGPPVISRACLGVAGPVDGERARMTNRNWDIDSAALGLEFEIPEFCLVNDFAAAAHGLDALGAGDRVTLQPGAPIESAPRLLLGAGTGLGVTVLLSRGENLRVIAGVGGHAGFAPADELQDALCRHLRHSFGRVELEHVVSGAGLERIYAFLRDTGRRTGQALARQAPAGSASAAAITRAALDQGESLAIAALDLFISCYGAAAGDYALAVLARGGVYIAGGIAPKILPRLRGGGFVAAFNAKGNFSAAARSFPVHVVTNERVVLLGAQALALAGATRQAGL